MQINYADELLPDEVSLWWGERNCLGGKSKRLRLTFVPLTSSLTSSKLLVGIIARKSSKSLRTHFRASERNQQKKTFIKKGEAPFLSGAGLFLIRNEFHDIIKKCIDSHQCTSLI